MMVRELTPELAKIAKDELHEDPNRTPDDLHHLKEWISKQSHLKARTDDQWLIGMLRGCKFSLERVKKKIDIYYTLRTTAPDVTLRMKPTESRFLEFLRIGTCIILPKEKSALSPRFVLLRPGLYDPIKNNVADVMCTLYYLLQILLMEDDTASVIGVKILVDYQGVSMTHFSQGNPYLLKKMVAVSQEATPLRSKGSHHMNIPSGVEMIFTLVKHLLNEKAKQRLKIHKTQEDLLSNVPKEIIPVEYGGSGCTVAEITEYWVKKIIEYKPWMQQEEQFGTDESKRLGKPQTEEEMFGVEGSFRKLEID